MEKKKTFVFIVLAAITSVGISKENIQWIPAGNMQPGNYLRTNTGQFIKVISIKKRVAKQAMYNLTINQNHDFFISIEHQTTGVLVHNCRLQEDEKKLVTRLNDKGYISDTPEGYVQAVIPQNDPNVIFVGAENEGWAEGRFNRIGFRKLLDGRWELPIKMKKSEYFGNYIDQGVALGKSLKSAHGTSTIEEALVREYSAQINTEFSGVSERKIALESAYAKVMAEDDGSVQLIGYKSISDEPADIRVKALDVSGLPRLNEEDGGNFDDDLAKAIRLSLQEQ